MRTLVRHADCAIVHQRCPESGASFIFDIRKTILNEARVRFL